MANGTGFPASKYQSIFKHLASWGVVIGNEDENSRTGLFSSKSLDFILSMNEDKESIFYKKIDTQNIGITGHSQGGVGSINAVTRQENQLGKEWRYDVSKINIPYFRVAGTGYFDAGNAQDITVIKEQGVCPLLSINENYNAISNSVIEIMARCVDKDHGDILKESDGYMTAWFMYLLKNDNDAKNALLVNNEEILNNSNWSDAKKTH